MANRKKNRQQPPAGAAATPLQEDDESAALPPLEGAGDPAADVATAAPPIAAPLAEAGKKSKHIKVRFLKLWSSDRGPFLAGAEAELPELIAKSLAAEMVAEVI